MISIISLQHSQRVWSSWNEIGEGEVQKFLQNFDAIELGNYEYAYLIVTINKVIAINSKQVFQCDSSKFSKVISLLVMKK